MNVMRFCCLFLTVFILVPSRTRAEMLNQKQLLNPGYILAAPLKDFVSASSEGYCNDLEKGQYKEAAIGFQQRLNENGSDLAAFVGLAQAEPSFWPPAINRLKGRLADDSSPDLKFKLGTLYLYEWKVNRNTHTAELAQAKKLLTQAWHQSKQPVIGLLYAEVQLYQSPNLAEMSLVLDQLLAKLAGSQAYSEYLQASRSGWQGPPPSSQQIPLANLKPLRGVLKQLWSLNGARFGHGVMQGDHAEMVYDPMPEEQQKKFNYLAAWRKALEQRAGS